jgi:hypothetical protein
MHRLMDVGDLGSLTYLGICRGDLARVYIATEQMQQPLSQEDPECFSTFSAGQSCLAIPALVSWCSML